MVSHIPEENIYNISGKELILKIHKNKTFRAIKIINSIIKIAKDN